LHPHVLEFPEQARGHWSQDSNSSVKMPRLVDELLLRQLDPVRQR
jgi:hypothetical protein